MLLPAATFVAGVMLLHGQRVLPEVYWALTLLLLPIAQFCLPALRLGNLFAAGFFWALLHAHWMLTDAMPAQLEGLDLVARGTVIGLPESTGTRTRFDFRIEQLIDRDASVTAPGKVRLSWYREPPVLAPGQRWQLRVRLKQPHGFMNPGGFDYQGWLYRNGIRATGYVLAGAGNKLLAAGDWRSALQRLRLHIRTLIDDNLSRTSGAGLVKALVIGDRSGLDGDDWLLFRSTGTNHLVAISGLHIGIVAGLCFLLGDALWRRSSLLCLWLPAPQAAAILALVAAGGYAALAGFSVPTQRALLMLAVGLGALLMKRGLRPYHALGAAMLVLVVIDPRTPLSAGFWLSFVAVAVILLVLSGRVGKPGRIESWFAIQWFITLGMAPLLVAWQGSVPLLAPLVNLVAVPLFSLLLIPLALFAVGLSLLSLPLGQPLLELSGWLLVGGRDLLATIPAADYQFNLAGSRPWYLWLAAAAGVCLLLLPVGIPGRWLGAVWLLAAAVHAQEKPGQGAVWLDMLDVGQGLALVVRTREHLLLYDTGPRFSDSFDAGSAVVIPFLRRQGVDRINRILLSNGDADHQGGFSTVAAQFSAIRVFSGEPGRVAGGRAEPCIAGTEWRWDGVSFRILHPPVGQSWKGNNASCVLMIENDSGRILITGDIEAAAENSLLQLGVEQLQADLVTVPHHGSSSSSRPGFVAATAPVFALVSAGRANRYGFPKGAVVERWERQGSTVINTASAGAVHFRLEPNQPVREPTRYRSLAQRYWHLNPMP